MTCPKLPLPYSKTRTQLKREFQRLALADKNVRTALYTCDAFLSLIMKWEGKQLPFEVSDAFLGAIVVSYACPFTDNNGPGVLPKKWRKFGRQSLQRAHDDMLRLRNEQFAHTDAAVHEIMILPPGCIPPEAGPKPPQVAYTIAGNLIPPQNVVRYRAACRDLQSRLEIESQAILAKLYSGLELPKRKFRLQYHDGL